MPRGQIVLLGFALGALIPGVSFATETVTDSIYTFREPSEGGTGKVYMGREIATVMGHRHAAWLDRPEREAKDSPSTLLQNLELDSTDVVADIGAGSGYMSLRLSPLVPDGMVLAVDIQDEMLDIIREKLQRTGVDNVLPVLGSVTDPNLPEGGVDLVLMVDTYHEFSHPYEMMTAIYRALRPGGRVVLVEFRREDPDVTVKLVHKMSQDQARAEMAEVGLRWVDTRDVLPRQHLMVFVRPDSATVDAAPAVD